MTGLDPEVAHMLMSVLNKQHITAEIGSDAFKQALDIATRATGQLQAAMDGEHQMPSPGQVLVVYSDGHTITADESQIQSFLESR